jgi:predicted transcriptional regulator
VLHMTAGAIKQKAHALIEALPDSATWDEVLYALELAADIEQGRRDADAGRTVDTDTVRRDLGLTR